MFGGLKWYTYFWYIKNETNMVQIANRLKFYSKENIKHELAHDMSIVSIVESKYKSKQARKKHLSVLSKEISFSEKFYTGSVKTALRDVARNHPLNFN